MAFIPIVSLIKVKPDVIEEKTAGGIILPETTKEQEKTAVDTGIVISVGEGAYDGNRNVVKEGDRILFAKYAGKLYKENGEQIRFIQDNDVVAVYRQ